MVTCRDEQLRQRLQRSQRRLHARGKHAPVVGPLVLSSLIQVGVITGAIALGLPAAMVVGVVLLTAVLTAIVWRRTVSSLVAGAGLLLAQPYEPGEQIRVFVPALGSVEDAEIVRVGPANTTLLTENGVVLVPNAVMLRGGART